MATGDIVVQAHVLNADRLAAALTANSIEVAAFTNRTTLQYGQRLLTAIRGRQSGRPGPRAQTGDFRRATTLTIRHTPTSVSASVGNSSPQAARLEYGFQQGVSPQNGVDVLGRRFNQPPYPSFGPAFDVISAQYRAAMAHGIAIIAAGGHL